jgi:hypothetical protein
MVGFELGPRNGAFLSLALVAFFVGFVDIPCFFKRISAAAARSARIFSRSASVKLLSIIGFGRSCFGLLLLSKLLLRTAFSLAVPNR